jgi:hypothetical protein
MSLANKSCKIKKLLSILMFFFEPVPEQNLALRVPNIYPSKFSVNNPDWEFR